MLRISLLLLCFAVPPAAAQVPEDPAERMVWLQAAEHQILMRRESWLAAESRFEEPLWIESDAGYEVVEGKQVFDNLTTLMELSVAVGVDEALGPDMPGFMRDIAEEVAGERAEQVRSAVVDAYRKHSDSVKARALARTDELLATIQDAFSDAQAKRDGAGSGEAAADLLAQARASLPAGIVVVEEPVLGRKCSGQNRRNPVYVVVEDRGKCTAPWGPYGGKKRVNGRVVGQYCAWCPAGFRWRSGSGCCVPE